MFKVQKVKTTMLHYLALILIVILILIINVLFAAVCMLPGINQADAIHTASYARSHVYSHSR